MRCLVLKFKENSTDKIIYEYVLKPKVLVLIGKYDKLRI